MGTGALGLNILGQGISADPPLQWINQTQPRSCVIIDEEKLAALALDICPVVIFRRSDDDHADEKFNPRQFARDLNARAPAGCWLYGGNEPGSDNLQRLNNWTLDFVDECRILGRKPVILNNFVFHPVQGLEGWKILAPCMKLCLQNGGAIGHHVYFNVTIEQSADAFEDIAFIRQVTGNPSARIIITEYACAVNYDPYAGYKTVYDGKAHNDQCEIGIRRYGNAYTDWTLFVYGNWDRTPTFDVSSYSDEVRNDIARLNTEARIPMPPTTSCPDVSTLGDLVQGAVTFVNNQFSNVRQSCSASSADIGNVYVGDRLTFYAVPSAVVNDYRWYRVTAPINGWVAFKDTNGKTITTIVPDVAPPPVTDLVYTRDQITQISLLLTTAEECIADAREILAKGQPSTGGGGF